MAILNIVILQVHRNFGTVFDMFNIFSGLYIGINMDENLQDDS